MLTAWINRKAKEVFGLTGKPIAPVEVYRVERIPSTIHRVLFIKPNGDRYILRSAPFPFKDFVRYAESVREKMDAGQTFYIPETWGFWPAAEAPDWESSEDKLVSVDEEEWISGRRREAAT